MILITGAAGFIGSRLACFLYENGQRNLVLVDDFNRADRRSNWWSLRQCQRVHRDQVVDWLHQHGSSIRFVYHLGARTDTTLARRRPFTELNEAFSKKMWWFCTRQQVPMVYASSAATYGGGEYGFDDNHLIVNELQPLNAYAWSKQRFDQWALRQTQTPPRWYGLKFFNVYGAGESHKGRMASVVYHTWQQIRTTGKMRLFRSHRSDIADGQQQRDFISVDDVVRVAHFFQTYPPTANGLYNVGTGQARSFWDLATATFRTMNLEPQISFIDTPLDIRATYQYFTEAAIEKLRTAGYGERFLSLEAGVRGYVQQLQRQQKV